MKTKGKEREKYLELDMSPGTNIKMNPTSAILFSTAASMTTVLFS